MSGTIQFIGLSDLDESDQAKVNSLTSKYQEKLRKLLDIAPLAIHIKTFKKSDHPSKYSMHIKLASQSRVFEVEKIDWDLTKVIHLSFEALINEINHYLGSEPKFMKRNAK
jgi:hypothetical protein